MTPQHSDHLGDLDALLREIRTGETVCSESKALAAEVLRLRKAIGPLREVLANEGTWKGGTTTKGWVANLDAILNPTELLEKLT